MAEYAQLDKALEVMVALERERGQAIRTIRQLEAMQRQFTAIVEEQAILRYYARNRQC